MVSAVTHLVFGCLMSVSCPCDTQLYLGIQKKHGFQMDLSDFALGSRGYN